MLVCACLGHDQGAMSTRQSQPGTEQGVSPVKGGSLNMNRTTVASPGIAQVGYEEGSETLEIEFVSGKIFQFYNVPLNLFNQLMKSSQKELYYESNILVRFPYTRIL